MSEPSRTSTRSIGGDEVALMHPSHVATLTDRRLYIGDVGNSRIVQVKLGYHREKTIPLSQIENQGNKLPTETK